MLKFLNITDPHLGISRYGKSNLETGIHTRIEDTVKSIKTACEIALKEQVDFITILGDIYDNNTPSNIKRDLLMEALSPALGVIDIYYIVGNHDKEIRSHALSSIKKLGISNKLHIIDTPTNIKVKEYTLVFVPFLETKKMADYIKDNSKISNSLLFGHFSTSNAIFSNGWVPDPDEEIVSILALEQSSFLGVYLGHIHRRQILSEKKPIMYCGSLVKTKFDELSDGDKGVILTTIEGGKLFNSFIEIPDRPFIEVDYKSIKDLSINKESIIKITGEYAESDRANINLEDIKQEAQAKCFEIHDMDINITDTETDDSQNQVFTPVLSTLESLQKWAEVNKLSQEFVNKGKEIIDGTKV